MHTVFQRKAMGRSQNLLCAIFLGLAFKGIIIITGNSAQKTDDDIKITVEKKGKDILLNCKASSDVDSITWKKNGKVLDYHKNSSLHLGSALDDPRGFYECFTSNKNASLQVFFQMCQNCIQLNLVTIFGIVLASFVATFFLAVGVYCVAKEEPARRSRASDKQTLLANEQLYQPLGDRSNGQYSHIGVAKTRHR